LNIDKLIDSPDYEALQDNLSHVTFCDLEREFAGDVLDSNLVKLFRLAQLELEYLLHTQEILAEAVDGLNKRVVDGELVSDLSFIIYRSLWSNSRIFGITFFPLQVIGPFFISKLGKY
jgi:hypothetical protein